MTELHHRKTLHTLNKTAANEAVNSTLSKVIANTDSVLLLEDGVYQCLNFDNNSNEWSKTAKSVFALKEDAVARGISVDHYKIQFISYEEFVDLSLVHHKVVSWY